MTENIGYADHRVSLPILSLCSLWKHGCNMYLVALTDLYADVRLRDFPRTCIQKLRANVMVILHVPSAIVSWE
jgi:hypothetical protein